MMSFVLAENLHRIMSEAKLSASELGRRIDLPSATIKKIRTGENANPTISTLLPIANYFGLCISQLLGELPMSEKFSAAAGKDVKTFTIPIISWEEASSWPKSKSKNTKHKQKYILVTDNEISKLAYALTIQSGEYEVFQKDSLIVVDPESNYDNNDYVLVHKHGQPKPNIRKIIKDDDIIYLQSLVPGLSSTTIQLTDDYKVLGSVIAYKKWFKVKQSHINGHAKNG